MCSSDLTPSAWDGFIEAWRSMLCSVGPYPVDSFHSADIEAAKPPFDGWPLDARRALVGRAIEIIKDESLCVHMKAVSCSFVLPDFKHVHPELLGRGAIADIYERCYRVLLFNVLKKFNFNGIDFIFDEKEKVKGRVSQHFDSAKRAINAIPDLSEIGRAHV